MSDNSLIKFIRFKKLKDKDINKAMELSLKIFIECNSSDFNEEGLKSFKEFISNENYTKELSIYGAYKETQLVGIIAAKNAGTHISLFFVDKEFQGMGIGKELFFLLLSEHNPTTVTVNSSMYAIEFYKKMGFKMMNEPIIKEGLRFLPMIMNNKNLL